MRYKLAFGSVIIGRFIRPQIDENARQNARAIWAVVVATLRPNASSDRLGSKRLSIERPTSYRTMAINFQQINSRQIRRKLFRNFWQVADNDR